jgi:undecaprenyl-diphosphatase
VNILQDCVLATLQGLTEFLPISSSGHLVLMQHFLGLKNVPVLFDLVLHLGTTAAVIVVYYRLIGKVLHDSIVWLFTGSERGAISDRGTARLFFFIVLATCVTGILGFLFKDALTAFFYRPDIVPFFLIGTGVILFGTRFVRMGDIDMRSMRIGHAAILGAVQGLAMLPGISRSGSTISAGLYLGLTREFSGAFSFLLSIPSVLGASFVEFIQSGVSSSEYGLLVAGFAVSFGIGFIALKLLLLFLRRGSLYVFSYYCFAAALSAILLQKTGWIGG